MKLVALFIVVVADEHRLQLLSLMGSVFICVDPERIALVQYFYFTFH